MSQNFLQEIEYHSKPNTNKFYIRNIDFSSIDLSKRLKIAQINKQIQNLYQQAYTSFYVRNFHPFTLEQKKTQMLWEEIKAKESSPAHFFRIINKPTETCKPIKIFKSIFNQSEKKQTPVKRVIRQSSVSAPNSFSQSKSPKPKQRPATAVFRNQQKRINYCLGIYKSKTKKIEKKDLSKSLLITTMAINKKRNLTEQKFDLKEMKKRVESCDDNFVYPLKKTTLPHQHYNKSRSSKANQTSTKRTDDLTIKIDQTDYGPWELSNSITY